MLALDNEQINALPPDDRNRYAALEALFRQPGWQLVMALAQQNAAQALHQAANAQNWDSNRMAIGNRAAWLAIANLQRETQQVYEGIAARVVEERSLTDLSIESAFE